MNEWLVKAGYKNRFGNWEKDEIMFDSVFVSVVMVALILVGLMLWG